MSDITIRDALPTDIPMITSTYNHYIQTSTATFEETSVDPSTMLTRYNAIKSANLPYLVAISPGPSGHTKECQGQGEIVGYAYAALWHTRTAYRFSVENTVYVAPGHSRRGIGRRLVAATLAGARRAGKTTVLSLISIRPDERVEQHASISMHRSLGARLVGRMEKVGWKFGGWVDVCWLQFDLVSALGFFSWLLLCMWEAPLY